LCFDINESIRLAASGLPIQASDEVITDCIKFIIGRLRTFLIDEGYRYDVVDSVLAVLGTNPTLSMRNIKQLTDLTLAPDWLLTLQAYSRCVRIVRTQAGEYSVDLTKLTEEEEKTLYQKLVKVEEQISDPTSVQEFIDRFKTLIPDINTFFERVLVMDQDQAVRGNRLGLIQKVARLGASCADLSCLEGF
jgi:glycyl-tRNA synthetase beta subunit